MYIGDFYQNHDHAPIRQIVFFYLRLKYKYQWPKKLYTYFYEKITFYQIRTKNIKGICMVIIKSYPVQ